jgi:putative hydrolase of the HAD superfamily
MRRTLAAHGVASEQAVRSAVAEYERVRDATLHVFADVPPALDALRARGLTLIAATNGNVNLDTVGIGAYMAGLHYADRVGLAKPDVRFFTSALDRWGIAPGAALVVGDRFDNDYAPALAAGLPAVLVDRAGQVDDPAVLRVRSLAELPALVSGATPSTW